MDDKGIKALSKQVADLKERVNKLEDNSYTSDPDFTKHPTAYNLHGILGYLGIAIIIVAIGLSIGLFFHLAFI